MKRVPLQSIVVQRKGVAFSPPIGEAFEFTADEVKTITAVNPDAIGTEAVVDVAEVKTEAKTDDTNKPAADL